MAKVIGEVARRNSLDTIFHAAPVIATATTADGLMEADITAAHR